MLKKIAAAAIVVFAAACADDGSAEDINTPPTNETPDQTAGDMRSGDPNFAPVNAPSPSDPQTCMLLPQDDSACAHACDEDALRSFIAEGTCATFSCPLSDGRTLVVGGCN